jgi:hypothetical protein
MSLPSSMRRIMSDKSRGSFWRSPSAVAISRRARGETRRERGGLSEVSAEADDAPARISLLAPQEPLEAVVSAAVVDREYLVGAPQALERLCHLDVKRVDIGRFVANRNDDGRSTGIFVPGSLSSPD